jgi:DNA ligase-1
MRGFAEACDAIAATPGKLEKTALLAAYFRTLGDDDLASAARFLAGQTLGGPNDRNVAIGSRTIVAAAQRVWGVDDEELRLAYRATGDLGDALGRFAREPQDLGLFRESLSPSGLGALLGEAAGFAGPSAGRKRQTICERILSACSTVPEARYAIKVITGDLRIGLRESLVLDALALAFEREGELVRRAAMAAGDIGVVALAARAGELDRVAVAYGTPIAFMLASPIVFGSSYRELARGRWIAEDKYDGIRVQAHKDGDRVRIFSRTRSEVSASFPEVVAALAGCPGSFILDGEVVAQRDGNVLPFRFLQTRLQRKDPPPELLTDVPVRYVAFDALAHERDFLLESPLVERRGRLAEIVVPGAALDVAPWQAIEEHASPESIAETFERARQRGHEGLMLKRADSTYAPGRRGKAWLKLKRELTTLDVVVVAVEWGHGRRKDVLSDYTFAVRDRGQSGRLLTIGKAYSGLTDAEIAQMTDWFLQHTEDGTPAARTRRRLAVQPLTVIEVAFDVVAPSTLHSSGFALRFPRIARLRPDKLPSEIDSIEDVERIYAAMLVREGLGA